MRRRRASGRVDAVGGARCAAERRGKHQVHSIHPPCGAGAPRFIATPQTHRSYTSLPRATDSQFTNAQHSTRGLPLGELCGKVSVACTHLTQPAALRPLSSLIRPQPISSIRHLRVRHVSHLGHSCRPCRASDECSAPKMSTRCTRWDHPAASEPLTSPTHAIYAACIRVAGFPHSSMKT